MKQFKMVIALGICATIGLHSCRKDAATNEITHSSGYLVANEGNFGKLNASLSYIDINLKKVENNAYKKQNASEIGNTLNDTELYGNHIYMVVNASNKLLVASRSNLKKEYEIIKDLDNPRHIAVVNNFKYVTENNFGTGHRALKIFSNKNELVKTIKFTNYAENIEALGNYIFVQTDGAKWENGVFVSTGSTITRIDTRSNDIDKIISLNSNGIINDMDSNLHWIYVLTKEKDGTKIHGISERGTVHDYDFPAIKNPKKISVDKQNNKLYVLTSDNHIYEVDAHHSKLIRKVEGSSKTYPYSFDVIDGKIFIGFTDFREDSTLKVYYTDGKFLKDFKTGMGTNKVIKL